MTVYPLVFEPIFKRRIWGGRRLASILAKTLPADQPIGESWEIADLEDDQSVVAVGPQRGKTLAQLVELWGDELIGRAPLVDGRFPLLIKFLDARDTLSVQVHPDRAMAARRGGAVRIKNEAWYVIDADDDAFIYRGVKSGVDVDALRRSIGLGDIESVLIKVPARRGHCFYLPSGTVHALGAGVTVAEVQTPSDVTYRMFDFNRVDEATGKQRELHVEEALACACFDPVPPEAESPQHLASVWTSVTSLVRSESFVIERVRMVDGVEQEIPYAEMVIWMVLEGHGTIACDGLPKPLEFTVGNTLLLPAGLKNGRVRANENCMWLEVSVPIESSLTGFDRPEREKPQSSSSTGGYVDLNVPQRSGPPTGGGD